ncbi:MAG: glycosyltransferase family 4 protein [Deltaproteobacteria bacterium]|nr:glycosyltransferase family 4 protein [Kofleriaceae bacterium]
MTIQFDWITDVPTPYRNHLFEKMVEIFPRHDIEFRVRFMAWTVTRRPWNFANDELNYPWTLHRNVLSRLARREIHINPGLLGALRTEPADVVMIGGWASPTHVAAPFVTPKSVVKILGCESHLDSMQRRDRFSTAVKRGVVRSYDAFLVPGTRSRELICALDADAAEKPWVMLPNVIDAKLFRDRVTSLRRDRDALRKKHAVPDGHQLWFCPARLVPEKGLLEFLPRLEGIERVQLLIAGDGPLRQDVDALLARARLPVRLLGHRPEADVLELYAAADVFVLPSMADASPLSAVEAAAAGLPLLLSRRAGNSDELVVEGHNGWIYEVDGGEATLDQLRRVAAMAPAELAIMGERSREIYMTRFNSDVCVERLATFIEGLVERKA